MAAPQHTSTTAEDKILLSGVHLDLTDGIRRHALDQLLPLLRHNPRIIRIEVRLNQDQQQGSKYHFAATGQINIGGPDLIATAEGEDAYGALDGLAAKLDDLLRRRHDRRIDKRQHPEPTELDVPLPKTGRDN